MVQFVSWASTVAYFFVTLNAQGLCVVSTTTSFGQAALLFLIQALLNMIIVLQWERGDREQFVRTLAAVGAEEDYRSLLENLYPPQVVHQLALNQPVVPRLHKRVAIMWCDIVGFTALSAARGPHELFLLLNLIYQASVFHFRFGVVCHYVWCNPHNPCCAGL